MARRKKSPPPEGTESYKHPEATSPMRPDVGTQAQFRKKKPAVTFKYDSSLSPALEWDGQNPAREQGERLIAELQEGLRRLAAADLSDAARAKLVGRLQAAAGELKALGRPFLNWAGKAERLSFDVPTLPLFVHERLSTQAIIETLTGHKKESEKWEYLDLFADPKHSIKDQVLKAYEHQDKWVNRMILGDSLVVMNSLLQYESLGGQVQMIYMDPPYGVKFGSNFQPFVRKRDVTHNDDNDFTREPEMVQAYRDTWELGLHSYLAYLRDRLVLCRELLAENGSLFLQIGNENIHHALELLDEVFGEQNRIAVITFVKTSGSTGEFLPGTTDFILYYARNRDRLKDKFKNQYVDKSVASEIGGPYSWLELPDGERRRMTREERESPSSIPKGAKVFRLDNLQSQSMGREKGEGSACWFPVEYGERTWRPNDRSRWKTNEEGMARLKAGKRLEATSGGLYYVRYIDDFPAQPINDTWLDTVIAGFASEKMYVVETNTKVIQRCMMMSTAPGDLVLDVTCGSGATAFVAEQWGRRWITCDVSRVPLSLARQRLLTATFPWFELADEGRGPVGGFVYKRKKNRKGEEVGGIVPHVMLKNIASNEPPTEEVLVDRPEVKSGVTRVSGPFAFEATMPTPTDWNEASESAPSATGGAETGAADRLLEALRRSPTLHLGGKKTVTLKNVRRPARTLTLSAEAAVINGEEKAVAFVFGPENGPVVERLVFEAAKEANAKNYRHLYVVGFAIDPKAREFIETCDQAAGVPATYVQATPDLLMGDLLKNLRSSQIFSVCGLPEIKIHKATGKPAKYQVELLGLDVFDPITMEADHRQGDDVPAWFLDTDYNGLSFHVCQAFFPRTAAWDNLKKALKATHDEAVWDHLAGTKSAPFEAGEQKQVAVKVIDDRGNELMVVKGLK